MSRIFIGDQSVFKNVGEVRDAVFATKGEWGFGLGVELGSDGERKEIYPAVVKFSKSGFAGQWFGVIPEMDGDEGFFVLKSANVEGIENKSLTKQELIAATANQPSLLADAYTGYVYVAQDKIRAWDGAEVMNISPPDSSNQDQSNSVDAVVADEAVSEAINGWAQEIADIRVDTGGIVNFDVNGRIVSVRFEQGPKPDTLGVSIEGTDDSVLTFSTASEVFNPTVIAWVVFVLIALESRVESGDKQKTVSRLFDLMSTGDSGTIPVSVEGGITKVRYSHGDSEKGASVELPGHFAALSMDKAGAGFNIERLGSLIEAIAHLNPEPRLLGAPDYKEEEGSGEIEKAVLGSVKTIIDNFDTSTNTVEVPIDGGVVGVEYTHGGFYDHATVGVPGTNTLLRLDKYDEKFTPLGVVRLIISLAQLSPEIVLANTETPRQVDVLYK